MESRVSVPVLAINDPLRLDSLDGSEGDMPEQRRVLDGAPPDTVLAALRRAGVEASASEAWSGLLSGEIDAPVVVLATLLASGMRDDAAQWRTSREATPSLLALVRRRSRWDTAALAQVLGIDHRSAAALLHREDIALSPTTYRTWQRR